MVNPAPERKADADYSLQRVVELASRLAVAFSSKSVQRDVENLGYERDDVCDCIAALQVHHFSHSERYRPGGPWHDVYRIEWVLEEADADPLYIKFRLNGDLILIELCSFHRQR